MLYFSTAAGGAWYGVAAEHKGGRWIAILPRVTSSARIHYRLVTSDSTGKVLSRLPARGAYIADVVDQPCATGMAPSQTTASITLTVPANSPRIPPGFDAANIVAFVAEPTASSAPPPSSKPKPPATPAKTRPARHKLTEYRVGLHAGTRIRITNQDGSRHSGEVISADDSGVRLEGKKGTLPWSQVSRVEEYEGPGAGRRILGALAGAGGGFAISIVYYVASEDVDSANPLYIGTIGGALIGALVVGGHWRTVATVGHPVQAKKEGAVKWLARRAYIVPQRGGARAGIGLQF
jgi:hypothetical protein